MEKPLAIMLFVLLFCLIYGCRNAEKGITDEEARALIDRTLEYWSGGDVDIVDEVIAPEYVIYLDPHDEYEKQTLDRSAYKERVLYGRTFFSDSLYTYEDLIAEGDRVVVRYIVRGVHTGDVEGFPATGNTFETSSIEIIRIEGGKIAESWEEYDNLGHYEQLGMELKMKEGMSNIPIQ